ncbi:hypothetical protein [Paenibacillus illinoisensis]|uniref:Uncharacterized protein n=1 Tax=Paenibacillus illinoisensis TaxID=59845 RepID=A0A2W0CFI4_9BACL|nr:hypothetical protein [Paenibacillus illinoisensis]PYY31027.1 hypothetical protein PIL02S_00574 [Paenibacillus illinoisensis]
MSALIFTKLKYRLNIKVMKQTIAIDHCLFYRPQKMIYFTPEKQIDPHKVATHHKIQNGIKQLKHYLVYIIKIMSHSILQVPIALQFLGI